MPVELKRAYEAAAASDGYRVLVDRVWPRGIGKDALAIAAWRKDLAPSTPLRRWFAHDAAKWETFRQRYFDELAARSEALEELLARAEQGRVTLVFAAKDRERNNAVALKEYLEQRLRR